MGTSTWTIIVSILSLPLIAFFAWWFNRPKYVSEIYSSVSQSSQQAVEMMQATMETLYKELMGAQTKITDLTATVANLQTEVAGLKDAWSASIRENIALKVQVYELSGTLAEYARREMNDAIMDKENHEGW